MQRLTISAGETRAGIALTGAELRQLALPGLGPVLATPAAAWPYAAPILFPVIGRSDAVHPGGAGPLPVHGFVRDMDFEVLDHSAATCRLVLRETDDTQSLFPFRFRLEAAFAAFPDRLEMTLAVTNDGGGDMPFDIGLHPGFRWPLVPGVDKNAHLARMDRAPQFPAVAVRKARLAPETEAGVQPDGNTLRLRESWFEEGAFAFAGMDDSRIRFGAEAGPMLELAPDNFGCLAFWSRGREDFLCIEPWSGLPDAPDAADRAPPGSRLLTANATATFRLVIGVAAVSRPE